MFDPELPLRNSSELLVTLIEAAGAWLHYEGVCGNDVLLCEDSLRYAVGKCLKSVYARSGTTERNCAHPAFHGSNDVRRCDLGVVDAGKLLVAIEVKWVDSDQPSKWLARIIQDVIRLSITGAERSYLLLAGEDVNLRGLFARTEFKCMPGRSSDDGYRDQILGLLPIGESPFASQRKPQSHRLDVSGSLELLKEKRRLEVTGHFKSVELPSEVIVCAQPPYRDGLQWLSTAKYNVYGWQVLPVKRLS